MLQVIEAMKKEKVELNEGDWEGGVSNNFKKTQ